MQFLLAHRCTLLLLFLVAVSPLPVKAWSLTSSCNGTGQALQFDNTLGWKCVNTVVQKSDVYAASSGFTYTIPNYITIEIINSSSLLGTGTITLPSVPTDGMPLTIEAPKGITLVSVVPNAGQSLSGISIATMNAAVPYRLKYSSINSTWYPN